MPSLGSIVHNEQRVTKRKVLKVRALWTAEGAGTVMARTLDVGGEGVCLLLALAVKPGSTGMVRFDIFHDGKVTAISARSRVQYCILSHGAYKTGFQFVQVELSAMAALSRFLH